MNRFLLLILLSLCARTLSQASCPLEEGADPGDPSCVGAIVSMPNIDALLTGVPHASLVRQYITETDKLAVCTPLFKAQRDVSTTRALARRLAQMHLDRINALVHADFEASQLLYVLEYGRAIASKELAVLADLLGQRRVSKYPEDVAYIVARFQGLPPKVNRIISRTVPTLYVPDVMRHAMCFQNEPRKLALIGPLVAGTVRAPGFARSIAACQISVEELKRIGRLSGPLRACHFQEGRVYPSPERQALVTQLGEACEAHHEAALAYELSKGFQEGALDDGHLNSLVGLRFSPLRRICALRLRTYLSLKDPNYRRFQVFLGLMEGFDESANSMKRMRAMTRVLMTNEVNEAGRTPTDLAYDVIRVGFETKVRHKILEWYHKNRAHMTRKHLPFVKRLLVSFPQERHPTLLRALERGQTPWQLKALTLADLTTDQVLLLLRRASVVKQENWIPLVRVLSKWAGGALEEDVTQADYVGWACAREPKTFINYVSQTHPHVLSPTLTTAVCAEPQ
ncbi:MAG: hypothetical protein LCH26_05070 [Proteobacteria bacterium]|nr:hypothetical protein [Pseudomonadota bacterium]